MKKFIAIFLSIVTLFTVKASARVFCEEEVDMTPLVAVPIIADAEELDIKAKSAILIDADSGKILYEKNADYKMPPASITKIMSLILVMETIEKGNLTYDTVLTCSDTAAKLGGSQIWLESGEQMTVHDLLKAVAVVSANDATVMLAEAVAGSEESFVSLMNEKAKALGMNNTNFINSTGLDAESHYSSAYDVALMSAELLKYNKITEYTTIWMDSLRNGESELVSTNKLVRFYEGCTGLKTGTTADAGYCLSASAKRDDLHLIAVVMGANSSTDRFAGAQKLLNYGFANYTRVEVKMDISDCNVLKVKKGTKKTVQAEIEESFYALVKKSDKDKITTQVILPKEVAAPIEKGQTLGNVSILINGEEIGNLPVVSADSVNSINLWRSFGILLKYLFHL